MLCTFLLIGLSIFTSFNSSAQDSDVPAHPFFTGEVHEAPEMQFDQEHVRLALRFEPEEGRLFGVMTLRVRPIVDSLDVLPLAANEIDVYGVQVGLLDSLQLNAAHADSAGSLWISLDSLQTTNAPFEVRVTYSATPKTGMHFRRIASSDTTYATHIWTDDTPGTLGNWLPLIDNPADRLTSEIIATVPPAMSVISNGRLIEEMETEDQMALYHYVQDQLHAAHHIGLVVGYFEKLDDEIGLPNGSSVTYSRWLPSYGLHHAATTFAEVPDILRFFSEHLDFSYPWPQYTQVVYDGMLLENSSFTGFSLLNDRVLTDDRARIDDPGILYLATTVAQQWAGHLTASDFWSELWLPQSLSHFLGMLYLKKQAGEVEYFIELERLKNAYLAESKIYSRPLVWNQWSSPLSMKDTHGTAKGVWVLHSLYQMMGEESFLAALRDFFSRQAFQPISTDDFLNSLNTAFNKSLDTFFDNWVYSAGHPEINLDYQHDLVAESLYVSIEQTQDGYLVPPFYSMDTSLESYSLSGPARYDITLSEQDELIALATPIQPRYVLPDPEHRFLAERFVEQGASSWITQLRYATNPLSQIEAIRNLTLFVDDPALLIGLQSALSSRPAAVVRAGIIELVATLPQTDATKRTILEAYEDPDPAIKRVVLRSLERFEDHTDLTILALEAAQSAESYALQAQGVETLARIGAPGAADVIESALVTPSYRDIIRRTALRSLFFLDISSRERIEKTLRYTEPEHSTEARTAAIENLGIFADLDNRRSANALISLLDDPDPLIRKVAVQTLGQTKLEEARESLQNRLEKEEEPLVRLQILAALGQ